MRTTGAASVEHAFKEEVQEELVSPRSTEDVYSPRISNGISGQLLNFREEAPLSSTGLVGVEGNLWGGSEAGAEVPGRYDAGVGDGRTRIQFVAREGETLSQILQQVESLEMCCCVLLLHHNQCRVTDVLCAYLSDARYRVHNPRPTRY